MKEKTARIIQILVFFSVLLWSVLNPYNMLIWFMESLPAIMAFVILAYTYRKFRLADVTYWLILIHCLILMVGAHYTYSKVPLFEWLKIYFEMSRNNYDKLGHFAQGFVPAVVIREILIRTSPLRTGKWLFFIVSCITLAISACYEFIEWWSAVFYGDGTVEFLGLQGYVWDAQSDMLYALTGAIISQLLFKKTIDAHSYNSAGITD